MQNKTVWCAVFISAGGWGVLTGTQVKHSDIFQRLKIAGTHEESTGIVFRYTVN